MVKLSFLFLWRGNTLWHPPGGGVSFTVFFHSMWTEMRPRIWEGKCVLFGRGSLTRSVSCSVVCPCAQPVWSWDLGRGKPWSRSSYGALIVWGCLVSGGGQPALKEDHKMQNSLINEADCSAAPINVWWWLVKCVFASRKILKLSLPSKKKMSDLSLPT